MPNETQLLLKNDIYKVIYLYLPRIVVMVKSGT